MPKASKQSPNGRKFAQCGHPALHQLHRLLCKNLHQRPLDQDMMSRLLWKTLQCFPKAFVAIVGFAPVYFSLPGANPTTSEFTTTTPALQ
jgi:hypothetical protein